MLNPLIPRAFRKKKLYTLFQTSAT